MTGWASITGECVFWSSLLLIAYNYFLYPALLFCAYVLVQIRRDWQYLTTRNNRRTRVLQLQELPGVSVIVPAYNEQDSLPRKLVNCREIDYPQDKLEIIFVSDGSTDRTNRILSELDNPNAQVLLLGERKGKSNALNEAVKLARHGVLVFSDATTLLARDTVRMLVRHFANPSIGVACGALRFQATLESRRTEGLYWKYESILRLLETRLGISLTASGGLYALRRCCYSPVDPGTIIEDLVIPLNAQALGYEVIYDPEAVGTEFAASTVAAEFTRRVRLAVGSFKVLAALPSMGLKGFSWVAAFISHKLLRWIAPFLLTAILLSNCFLAGRPMYRVLLMGQLIFYSWAVLGFLFRNRMQRVRYALVGYFLLAMNLAFLLGFIRFLFGRVETTWQRVN